jgi:hypothetical protein
VVEPGRPAASGVVVDVVVVAPVLTRTPSVRAVVHNGW